ncbi:hypothetical protein [Vibrio vulnificus]|uniref:hypothetical protein n=1 Tax=Vibrio vulnificus TaxID=672 RepID=UPI00092BA78E|nr:hypothetical protein [Vibrio vulnificus]OJI53865.1 hypothetical protein VFL11327_04422 [Vibrio fluvialis]OJI53920.1 hypothetical protein VV1062A_02906 [Vibrio vulnificus]POB21990.1 hypothetical protein CRN47_18870 [Vibrio vulnificus]
MEQEKAYSIIDALANGVDPNTGECFPKDSPYNNPDVIRALFYVLRNKPVQKKHKRSLEEKQRENVEKGLPKNHGLPWTDESVEYVINQYHANASIDVIALDVARKPNSIIGLLKKKEVITDGQAFSLGLRYQGARA